MSNKVSDSHTKLAASDQLKSEDIPLQRQSGERGDDEAEWIRSNFNKRCCVKFVYGETDGDQMRCCCGHPPGGRHVKSAGVGERWREETCTAEDGPTDAFGDIVFTGGKVAKYARIDKQSSEQAVKSLLLDAWDMPYPNMIISVKGGAKKLKLNNRLKKAFKRGLMDAAQSTGAWIVTAGGAEGVTKLVGQSVRDYASAESQPVTCLGIAPWGCVANRQQLVATGDQPVAYGHSYRLQPNTCNLDVNHTHFLLVDNGTQLRFGAEIAARSRVEATLASLKTDSTSDAVNVPLVNVVVQGGLGTFEAVKCAVEDGTPVVLVKGSKGAADLLAYAYQYSQPSECVDIDDDDREVVRVERLLTRDQIVQLTERLREEFGESRVPQLVDWIETVLKFDHLVNVYELESDEFSCELDVAIMQAVMKANSRKEDQLRLALTLNRDDIAKNFIFSGEIDWSTHDMEPFMYKALVLNRPNFVQIFLDNNFMMNEFLSIEKLIFLYNTLYPDTRAKEHVWRIFMRKRDKGKRYFSLEDVGEVLEELAGRFYQSPYLWDPRYVGLCPDAVIRPDELGPTSDSDTKDKLPILRNSRAKIFIQRSEAEVNVPLPHFDDPFNDLFVWSVVTARIPMARLLWQEVSEPLAAALFAHLVWKRMAKKVKESAKEREELEAASDEFEQLAIGLSREASRRDPVKSELLLIRVSEFYGRATPLQFASYARSLQFIGEEAPQSLLSDVWNGGVSSENSSLKLFLYTLLTLLFFPLYIAGVLFGTSFTEEAKRRRQSQMDWMDNDNDIDEIYIRKGNARSIKKLERGLESENIRFVTTGAGMSCGRKFFTFHTSPRVIFLYNFLFYLLFLLLYSYALLTEFNPVIHVSEILLMVWIGSLVQEELRQALFINRHSFREKLIEYVTDLWNIMDMVILLIFLLAVVLRVIPVEDTLNAGRILYSIDLILFFFRLLYFFTINERLGPYLVMIGQLLIDLFYFFIILLVLISGYGIAQQAILYPNSFKEIGLVKDVYHRAYFQLFGHFFLAKIQGEETCSFDEDVWGSNTLPRCPTPEGTWVAPILLAVYIILANLLLFSLLIATFSSTYSRIRGRTIETWRFMRLNLVREFSEKPCLPPPFILLSHLYQLVRTAGKRCWKCSNRRCCCNYNTRSPLQHRFSPSVDTRLKNWECVHIVELLRQMRKSEDQTEETMLKACMQKLGEMDQRMQLLTTRMEELSTAPAGSAGAAAAAAGGAPSAVATPRPPPPMPAAPTPRVSAELTSRIDRLEAKFDSTSKNLGAVLAAVQSFKSLGRSHSRPSRERPSVDRSPTQPSFDRPTPGSHVRSLTSPYPGTQVARLPVAESQVPWAGELPDYAPPQLCVEGGDDPDDAGGLTFNAYDAANGVERRSRCGDYAVVQSRPRNPIGRTGLAGRGALPRWGPNHRATLTITRWSRGSDGAASEKRGRRVLELLVLQPAAGDRQYRLPELQFGGLQLDATPQQLLQLPDCQLALDASKEAEEPLQKLLAAAAAPVAKGYRDDAANTDNAWTEAAEFNLHDEDGKLWSNVKFKAHASLGRTKWTEVSHKSEEKILAGHWAAVEKAIQLHNAYY